MSEKCERFALLFSNRKMSCLFNDCDIAPFCADNAEISGLIIILDYLSLYLSFVIKPARYYFGN